MTVWIIEPHDPIIVRDGRPFNLTPGIHATSLAFPFPSTTTGGIRSRAGLVNGTFAKSKIPIVKEIRVRGPLLAKIHVGENHEIEECFAPVPADALLYPVSSESEKKFHCKQLLPLDFPAELNSNLNKVTINGVTVSLSLVGLPGSNHDTSKPAKDAPLFWRWSFFENWLLHPLREITIAQTDLGHRGPVREQRMHVSIAADRLAANEGALFGTSGLEFTYSAEHKFHDAQRLALAVAVDSTNTEASHLLQTMGEGVAGFGGERRMVSWRKSTKEFPPCPEGLKTAVAQNKACRIVLLTPAYFEHGYYPQTLCQPKEGVTPQLRAIAIQRPQVVSGWDLALPGPKPTRRLAPAGTVIFLSLKGEDKDIKAWVETMWMQCVSDKGQNDQDNKDGFGLAVIGTWSGELETV